MGRRKNDGDKLLGILLIGIGATLLYYLKTGLDRENNAALIPDPLENRIDRVVSTLNARVGKNWGNWGAEALKYYLQNALPWSLVRLVNVISEVEQEAKWIYMVSDAKRQRAIAIAKAQGLV